MFDVGFGELLLLAVVGLLVLGPERLPVAIRQMGLWFGRFKRSYRTVRSEIEQQLGADEIRQELHNEEILKNLKNQETRRENSQTSTNDAKS